MKPECVLACANRLGEGPLWVPAEGRLYWTDIPAREVHRWAPQTGSHDRFAMADMVTALSTRRSGGFVVTTHKGVDLWDPETGTATRFATPEPDLPGNRANDAKCDRRGRFWVGTMASNLDENGAEQAMAGTTGSLYRIDGDGAVHRMNGPIAVSNTFAWSPDDSTMYFGDSAKGIYAYDFDAGRGTIANRRMFVPKDDRIPGFPDGSTIDAEGYLWNCRYDGGGTVRIAPDGAVDRWIDFSCRHVTSAIFGGDDLDTLYVTTAAFGLTDADLAGEPLAGGLFAIDTGVRGIAEVPFAA